jgi:hypothetical protein
VESQARVLAPLGGDAPDTMDLTVRVAGSGTLSIAVNGGWVADFPLSARLQDLSVRVPAWTWRPGMNEVALAADDALVDKLVFERAPASTFR